MHQTSIFIWSSHYIPEQSEPINFLDFSNKPCLNQSKIDTKIQQENLQRFNQRQNKNPYRSSWANAILNKHFNIDVIKMGHKIKIKKKLPDTEGNSQTLVTHLPVIQSSQQKDKSQLFSSTSQYTKNKLDECFKQKRKYHVSSSTENKSYNMHNSFIKQKETNDLFSLAWVKSQDRLMPIFDVNFKKNLLQYDI